MGLHARLAEWPNPCSSCRNSVDEWVALQFGDWLQAMTECPIVPILLEQVPLLPLSMQET